MIWLVIIPISLFFTGPEEKNIGQTSAATVQQPKLLQIKGGREHIAKLKDYSRKAPLFSYQLDLKSDSSAGCSCGNETWGKRVA